MPASETAQAGSLEGARAGSSPRTPLTPRAKARAQTIADILRLGREHLALHGAAALSLRAIARDLGVVSSAVYRYVESRDELLTLLLIDAYDELGAEVEAAVEAAGAGTGDFREGFRALCGAVRGWALREPSRYALLFGSPVPGYQAPAERTTAPGTRVVVRLMALLDAAYRAGALKENPGLAVPVAGKLRDDFEAIRAEFHLELPSELLAKGALVWTSLFGAVSFEVFGQYGAETFKAREELFEHHVAVLEGLAGLGG
jgi:AcrR family transcriptional regulator